MKTRLAASIGDDSAAEIYRAFLRDIGARFGRSGEWRLHWAFEPLEAPFAEEFANGEEAFAQSAGDLGERMRSAIARVLGAGYRSAVLIGSDVPHLATSVVKGAFERLANGARLVLGPADDGGYYLIGACTVPPVFGGVVWGGAGVLESTIAAARSAGIEPSLLARDYDVDDRASLERLRADLIAGRVGELPATAAALARVPAVRYK